MNLSPSIAITQNFVPEAHVGNVLDFMKNKPEQVSGFRSDVTNPYQLFVKKLGEQHPEILAEGMAAMERMQVGKKRKWDHLVNSYEEDSKAGGFSFGFGGDSDDVP